MSRFGRYEAIMSRLPLFSNYFTLRLRLRLQELGGGVLIFAALLAGTFVATYSPLNPSLNTAASAPFPATLSSMGFIAADLLKQLLGSGSWIFLLSLFSMGCRVLVHQKRVLTVGRILACLLSVALFCVVVQGCFPKILLEPIPSTTLPPGGMVGLLLARKIMRILMAYHWASLFIPLLVVCFLFFIVLWKNTLGLTFRDLYLSFQKVSRQFQLFLPKLRHLKGGKFQTSEPFESTVADEEEALNLEEVVPQPSEKNFSKKGTETKLPKKAIHNAEMYCLPSINLLANLKEDTGMGLLSREKLNERAEALLSVLSEFGIQGDIINIQPGPIVTMYEFRPAPGIKTSRIISLSDDIARSMSALSARIANIPGKNAIGIELPNDKRQTVFLRSLLASPDYKQTACALPLILGKDISGHPVLADLAKMPHLLVAGTTGSGKSVSINTMILSLLYKFSPEQCRFIMVDPKMLELSVYNDIPHLLTPVVTEPKKAVSALKWAVREMEARYKAMSQLGVRNIDGFNQKVAEGHKRGDVFMQRIQTGFDPETGKPIFEDQPLDYKELPYLVVVVDEMADLMLVAGKEIEIAVQRLAQMARAAGIHLIMATQRPSVDVITGTIKANFPTRISFQVTSKIDSRTILGEQGAEHLLGHGDMLYMSGGGRLQRVHGPFASDADVEAVTTYLKSQGEAEYVEGITDEVDETEALTGASVGGGKGDDLYNQAIAIIHQEGRVSISLIQRHLGIGYNKAAKLVEKMEKEGVVSSPDRTGKREILG